MPHITQKTEKTTFQLLHHVFTSILWCTLAKLINNTVTKSLFTTANHQQHIDVHSKFKYISLLQFTRSSAIAEGLHDALC